MACDRNSDAFVVKKLCCTRLDDRISSLPDEIILVVLSLLPLKNAAATSVLSSRWSHLWKHTSNLEFEGESELISRADGSSWDFEKCNYIQLVNNVLQSHEAISLQKFTISFYVNNKGQSAVAKWLEFVFLRKIEKLEFDFKCYQALYKVVLEELLRERRSCLQPKTDLVFFQSLKSLCWKCLKVSGKDIKLLLRSCPVLERLVLNSATLTSDVEVCGGADLMLKYLDMRLCNGGKSVKVSAPNLTCICFHEKSGKLSFGNVPKLKSMAFRVSTTNYVVQRFASTMSCFISQLQSLTLTLNHPKEFLENGFPKIPNLMKLVVCNKYGVYKQDGLMPITALIRATPRLQSFTLRFHGDSEDAAPNMEVVKNVERARHRCLKMFELQGSCRGISDHIVELLTYISTNCVALQKIIIGRPRKVIHDTGAEEQARDYLKQQLHGKLRRRIRLQYLEII